ncbi:MAG: hypothetical protein ACTS3T_20615 [Almyronema sp.]
MPIVPTIDDVFELAADINIPLPAWVHQMLDWASALHELAHWAVKPSGYIHRYLDKIQPYAPLIPVHSIPNADEVLLLPANALVRWPDGRQQSIRFNHVARYQLDPTPDEFGARAWGLQVIEKLGWCHPLSCPPSGQPLSDELGNAQFDPNLLTGEAHPISPYGPDQLLFMGIDVANGRFRPQVSVDFDGQWIRVYRDEAVIWSLDILAGGEVLAWESTTGHLPPGKPLLLEELRAIAGI